MVCIVGVQGWRMVRGDAGNGVGPVQHFPGVPVLAAVAGGGRCGLLHTLLGPHHRQCHVLRPAGQSLMQPYLAAVCWHVNLTASSPACAMCLFVLHSKSPGSVKVCQIKIGNVEFALLLFIYQLLLCQDHAALSASS